MSDQLETVKHVTKNLKNNENKLVGNVETSDIRQ